ncbi:hypothetical protein SCHPADRAFT_887358 [Schizopora paradoxa]|uniref:Uncharacterized protein n=1 Tax=Schizopora paradoxa TaxID=27342 RepID=A0A0H2SIN3_9AGAM|nr:hypothetical protein SCHPADRAFT_887358 [Schizopora paradoxa]
MSYWPSAETGGPFPWIYVNTEDSDSDRSAYSNSSNPSARDARIAQTAYGNQRRIYSSFVGTPPRPLLRVRREDILETPGVGAEGQKLYFGSVYMTMSNGVRQIYPCALECLDPARGHFRHNYMHLPAHRQAFFSMLPFYPRVMELVSTSRGRVPYNCRPIEGGFDSMGNTLYHGIAFVQIDTPDRPHWFAAIPGVFLPRCPRNRGGLRFCFGGSEIPVGEDDAYHILCWKF